MSKNSQRLVACVLALVWAGFWSVFVVASELAEKDSVMLKAFVCLMGVGFFLGSATLPLLWKRRGGILLLLEGILLSSVPFRYLHNPPMTQIFLFLTLAAPPLLSGLLLLMASPHPTK